MASMLEIFGCRIVRVLIFCPDFIALFLVAFHAKAEQFSLSNGMYALACVVHICRSR